MNKAMNKKKKGFTLIELIIVLAIMVIIAAIAIPNFIAVRDNSRTKADTQSAATIQRNVLMLVADNTIAPAATEKTYDVTEASGVVTVTMGGAGIAADETTLETALKETKAPQANGDTKYHIAIAANGDVAVTTAK